MEIKSKGSRIRKFQSEYTTNTENMATKPLSVNLLYVINIVNINLYSLNACY